MHYRSFHIIKRIVIAFFLILSATHLVAGPYIVYKDFGERATDLKFTRLNISDDGRRLRVDIDIDDFKRSTLYEAGAEYLTIINHNEKSFIQVSSANARQIEADIQKEIASLVETVKSKRVSADIDLAEAQLRAIKQNTIDRSDIEYETVAYAVRVHKWLTTHYKGYSGEAFIEEVFLLPWSEMLISKSQFDILDRMPDEFKALLSKQTLGDIVGVTFPFDLLNGLPVKVVKYGSTAPVRTTQLVLMKGKDRSASFFDIPLEYSKN